MKLFKLFKKKETHSPLSFLVGVIAIALLVTFLSKAEVPQVNWKGMMVWPGSGPGEVVSISNGLIVERIQFVRLGLDDEPIYLEDEKPVFTGGEKVIFALFNVGKFTKGDDGLHDFDMDIEVTGPEGEIILSEEKTMGGQGHMELENDIAPTPNAVFIAGVGLKKGDYNMKLTIYDNISGASAIESGIFVLN